MNKITQKELLAYHYEDAKRIVESQYLEIDENYNLLDRHEWITANSKNDHNVKGATQPLITINELEDIIVINIKYNRLDSFGHPVGDIELNLSKPKSIIKNGEIYNFDKIVK
jgi:hypothetical protein